MPSSASTRTPAPTLKSKAIRAEPVLLNPPPRKAPPEGVPQDITDDEMPRPPRISTSRMKELPALPPASPPPHSAPEPKRAIPALPPTQVPVPITPSHPVLRRIQTDFSSGRSASASPVVDASVKGAQGSATESSKSVRDSDAYALDAMELLPDRAIPRSVPTSAVDGRLSYDNGIRGSPPSTNPRFNHVLKSSLSEILKDQILPERPAAPVSSFDSDNGDKHSYDSPALTYASTSASSHSQRDSPVTSISTETVHDVTAPLVIRRKRFTQRGSGKDLQPPILNPTIRRNKSIPVNLNKERHVRFPDETNSTTPSTASSEAEFSLALLSRQMRLSKGDRDEGRYDRKRSGRRELRDDDQSDSGSSFGVRVPNS